MVVIEMPMAKTVMTVMRIVLGACWMKVAIAVLARAV